MNQGSSGDNIETYCVRCKEKRPIADGERTTLANGRPAIKGTCSVCGTNVVRLISGQAR